MRDNASWPHGGGLDSPGARRTRWALRVPRLRPSAALVLGASPGVLVRGWPDEAGEPGAGLRDASPQGSRRGLDPKTQGRSLAVNPADEASWARRPIEP